MTPLTMMFGHRRLHSEYVRGKDVLEVGSYNVNGSYRQMAEAFGPRSYIGVDIMAGPGVDEICSVYDLIERFGPQAFDCVIATEVLEHLADWQDAIYAMKMVTKADGYIILTTRAPGFPRHDFPSDFWRFTVDDLREAFSEWDIIVDWQTGSPDFGSHIIARRFKMIQPIQPDFTVAIAPYA